MNNHCYYLLQLLTKKMAQVVFHQIRYTYVTTRFCCSSETNSGMESLELNLICFWQTKNFCPENETLGPSVYADTLFHKCSHTVTMWYWRLVSQTQSFCSLVPRLSWNANMYCTESLVSFLRKHDVIKIGTKQKGNVLRVVQPTMFQRSVCMIFNAR